MKKVFILFFLLFVVGTSYSQNSAKSADAKLAYLLEDESYLKNLPQILSLVVERPTDFVSTKELNSTIVAAIVANGIGDDKVIHRHLRNYFGSNDPQVIKESEAFLLANL